MELLDESKHYDNKDLVKIINALIKELEEKANRPKLYELCNKPNSNRT